jgi:hypothetical protein
MDEICSHTVHCFLKDSEAIKIKEFFEPIFLKVRMIMSLKSFIDKQVTNVHEKI